MPTKNYADAMLDVLGRYMEEDPNFVVMGNEVLGIGPEGMQFEPFQKQYGDRILFPPCSEAAYTAMAAGAAMCGHRMFAHLGLASFTYPAISSIANEISTARTSSGGTIGVPVTLHISHGLLHGGGAQHSESPFGMYWNLPGIEIAAPSGAKEVKGLLTTAIKSENPTIVLTHAFGYGAEDDVPDGDFEIPFGKANVAREGSDVTIVACSMMTSIALGAAEELSGEGINAEVIDLRTLVPLDEKTILESVAKTGRLIVTDEGRMNCGVASEIAAMVSEKGLESLKASVARVARTDAPVAANQVQEEYISPHRGEDRLRGAPGGRRGSGRGRLARSRGAGGELAMALTKLDHVLVLDRGHGGDAGLLSRCPRPGGRRPAAPGVPRLLALRRRGALRARRGPGCLHGAFRDHRDRGVAAGAGHRRPRPSRLLRG